MTSATTKNLARLALFVAMFWCASLGMFGGSWLGEARYLASSITYYLISAMAFVAFPTARRNDLLSPLLCLGFAGELLGLVTGRSADLLEIASNLVGVLALYGASHLEQLRRVARGEPGRTGLSRRARHPTVIEARIIST